MLLTADSIRHACIPQGNFLQVYIRTTLIDCTIGVPGLSIPAGLAADGLPIGIMLQGKPGEAHTNPNQADGLCKYGHMQCYSCCLT